MKRISGGVNLTVFSTLVAGLAGGCSYEDESTGHEPGAGGAGQIEADSGVAEAGASAAGGGAAGSAGASEAGGLAGSLGEFCAGSGTVVATGDGLPKCTGQVASSVFKFALCSCEDVTFSGFEFTTDGFDSTNPKDPTKNGAAVGANNNYVVNANSKVGGSLLVAGAGQMGMNGSHVVSGDLKTNADELLPLGSVEVERDAWVAGDILGSGLNIKRDLYQPAGKQSIGATVGKSKVVAPVQIPSPCNCQQKLDIAGLVASFENNNDNAAAGLDPEALANVVGYRELTLPCGRYYLDSVNAATELVINVPNRVALFVGGDFFVSGNVKVSLAGTGEIDIFVVGDFLVNGAGHFGDPARPAGSRIYVAGNKGIALNGSSTFIGNLFAPNAIVSANSNLEVFGSIYSAGFVANGWAKIHYDKGILKAGEKCKQPPPKQCGMCGDCDSKQACKGGQCTACSADADCCPPLVCNSNGQCGPLAPH